jgi:hypothetical protein
MSPTNKSYVSIQLPLGGHSFSSNMLGSLSIDNNTTICAVVDTHKCCIVPRELLNSDNIHSHLHNVGIAIENNEIVVCGYDKEMVAVIAMSSECHQALTAKYESRICFTTPLLTTPLPEQGSVLRLSNKTLYVRIVNEGLKLMEAIEVNNDADILYALETINSVHGIYNMYARAEGDTKRLTKLCKKLFNNLEICE